MILAIVYNVNETSWIGESVQNIMQQLKDEKWEDDDDYHFDDIRWYELGKELKVTRETVYSIDGQKE